MTEGQPIRPANIEQIVAINQGRLPLALEEPSAPAVSPEEAARRLGEEDPPLLLDIRDAHAFASGHPPGAVNIQLASPEFEQRVGWVLPPESPILLFAEEEKSARRALRNLAFVGLDRNVSGCITGGFSAWAGAGLPVGILPQASVRELQERVGGNCRDGWRVVDVREEEEWAEGHIEGACHMNFKAMGAGAKEFPFDREETLSLICASGMRSSTAASLLMRHGFRRVVNVAGGMDAWRAAGLKVVTPA